MHLIESNMKRIFITYANERFAISEKLILKEAKSLGIFDKCIGYTPKDLPEYIKANPLMSFACGGGYWCWKPYVIWKTLQDYPDAVVIYADAGCKLQSGSEWDDWFQYMETYDTLVTAYRKDFDYGWIYNGKKESVECERWIKKDLLEYFDAYYPGTQWHMYPSLVAGIVFCKSSSKLIEEWYRFVLMHPEYMIDPLAMEINHQHKAYVAHRRDQSVLTALAYWGVENGWNVKIIPETSECRTDSAIVAARRVIRPVPIKTKFVNAIKIILGEKLYRKIHPKK